MRRALRLETVLIAASLLFTEFALQLASLASLTVRRTLAPPWKAQEIVVPDARLIGRGNPLRSDHDAWGYRNQAVPRSTDMVTLGDSQTYGGQDPLEAWPQVLYRETRCTVYNMALPGYGPAHGLLQLEEALTLQPKLLIVAPYFGNDFFEAFYLALKDSSLTAPVSPVLLGAAKALENENPLESAVFLLYKFGRESTEEKAASPLRRWVSDHCKLYGLFRAVKTRIRRANLPPPLLSRRFAIAASSLSPSQRKYASAFEGETWRTILTAPYRGRVVDDSDPRIRLGFEVSVQSVVAIAERCRAVGVNILVALIPTKESVFWPRVGTPQDHPGLQRLVKDEERLAKEFCSILDLHGIDYVDLREILRSAREQPYYEDADGHPNARGHTIIARAVAAHLAEGKCR